MLVLSWTTAFEQKVNEAEMGAGLTENRVSGSGAVSGIYRNKYKR